MDILEIMKERCRKPLPMMPDEEGGCATTSAEREKRLREVWVNGEPFLRPGNAREEIKTKQG